MWATAEQLSVPEQLPPDLAGMPGLIRSRWRQIRCRAKDSRGNVFALSEVGEASVTRRPPAIASIRALQRRHRVGLWRYVTRANAATALTAPVIYSMLLPLVLLDLWVTLYQAICFRAWGVKRVRRRDFFAIDRHKLPYLNALERMNCLYCGYANGLIAYVREIAARTEQYWCPIRHARPVRGPHDRYQLFLPYGDASVYRTGLARLRRAITR